MTRQNRVSAVALAVALLALVLSVTGGADAAAKIGKNLVVSKSIKAGAVTGDKVKDGSLTSADLAPGTIPVVTPPGSGKSVLLASRGNTPTAGNAATFLAPSGAYNQAEDPVPGIAPVAIQVADMHVLTAPEGIGQAVQVQLVFSTELGGTATPLLACTVLAGTGTCAAPGSAVIPAGDEFYFQITNGPGGSVGGILAVGYTVRVP